MTKRRGGVVSGWDDLHDSVGESSPIDGLGMQAGAGARSRATRSVALGDLVGNPFNPRDSIGNLDDLASIVDYQLQPAIAVTRDAFLKLYSEATIKARWVVIIGNRRLEAARKFGRAELDIVVKDELAKDKGTLLSAVIAENVDRQGFDVIEEAKAVEQLVAEYGSVNAAAEHLHKVPGWVSQRRNLLKLEPEVQEAIRRGDLAVREARTWGRLPKEEQVARWRAVAEKKEAGKRSAEPSDVSCVADEERAATSVRTVTRALRKFDTAPAGLAVALRDHLGEVRAKTLVSALRKVLK